MNNRIKRVLSYVLVFLCAVILTSDKVFAERKEGVNYSVGYCDDNGKRWYLSSNVDKSKLYKVVEENGKKVVRSNFIIAESAFEKVEKDEVESIGTLADGNTYNSRCLRIGDSWEKIEKWASEDGKEGGTHTEEGKNVYSYSCGEERLVGKEPMTGVEKNLDNLVDGIATISFDVPTNEWLVQKLKNGAYEKGYIGINAILNGTKLPVRVSTSQNDNGTTKITLTITGITIPDPGKSTEVSIIMNLNVKKLEADGVMNTDPSYYLGLGGGAIDADHLPFTEFKKYCGDIVYLTSYKFYINDKSQIQVTNTFKGNQECKDLLKYAEERGILEFAKKYIPICDLGTMSLSTYELGKSEFKEKKGKLEAMFESKYITSALKDKPDLMCTNQFLGIPSNNDDATLPFQQLNTYTAYGDYWAIACNEEYYVESSDPQIVKSGMGIKYPNKLQVNRVCRIVNTKQVVKPPQCEYALSVDCHYDQCSYCDKSMRDDSWTNPNTAGPNSDFDSCVSNCDGGTYTQSCINKCYSEVYNSDRKLSLADNDYDFYNNYIENKKLATEFTVTNAINSTVEENGITMNCEAKSCVGKANCCTFSYKGKTVEVGVSNYCAGQEASSISGKMITTSHGAGSKCEVKAYTYPDGCDSAAKEKYEAELAASRAEYTKLKELMEKAEVSIKEYRISFIEDEKVAYSVMGRYEVGSCSKEDGYTTFNADGVQLKIDKNDSLSSTTSAPGETVQIGSQPLFIDGKDYSKIDSATLEVKREMVYDIDLPVQYSLKTDARKILVKNNYEDKTYYQFSAPTDTFSFDVKSKDKNSKTVDMTISFNPYRFITYNELSDAELKKLASNGERVYYTNLDGGDTNVITYTSSKTTSTCGATLSDLIEESKTTTETRVDEYQTIFDTNAYIYYEINGEGYAKVLVPYENNIAVNFRIGTIGDTDHACNLGLKEVTKVNFDLSGYQCYYGVTNLIKKVETDKEVIETTPISCTCVGDDCNAGVCVGENCSNPTPTPTPDEGTSNVKNGLRYYYREIKLDDVFPNDRNPRYNWSAAAKDYTNPAYVVDPIKLTEDIEAKGESIYDDTSEYDYQWTLTPATMNEIRKYNSTKDTKLGRKPTYTDFSLVAASGVSSNYSQKIKDWFSDGLYGQALVRTECNNATGSACKNYK